MRYFSFLVLFLGTISLSAQDLDLSIDSVIRTDFSKNTRIKDSGFVIKGIYIGSRRIYVDGKLLYEINYGDYKLPRTIFTKTYSNKGKVSTSEGNYIQTSDKHITKHGAWKWYWKNGSVMDSVIFRDDHELLRARFSKSGKLQLIENYPEFAKNGDQIKITGYNRNGSIKFNRIEIKGKNGY
ncbi:MAG: hypothetical protein ABSD71_14440 [Bacteroidales bacterium]|jgi:hypothetical protein